ncbi:MAG: sulfatase-like hydrolase/transferase [Eubacteriales bacterium]
MQKEVNEKYNILYITSDQQHFNTIGKFNPEICTPNLDRLCDCGTCFDHAYTVNPTCTPTRASLITGTYPSQHGAWTLGTKLPETETTIGKLMQEDGMKTALIGKAHFQPLTSTTDYPSLEAYPILQDIDFWKNFDQDFYGFQTAKLARNHTSEAHVGQHYVAWLEEKGCDNWKDYFVAPTGNKDPNIQWEWDIPEEYHYDAWIAEETNKQLEEYKNNGDYFFLWASFFDPHPKYLVPKNWVDLYRPEDLTLPEMIQGEHEDSPIVVQKTQEDNPDYSAYERSGYALHGMVSHTHRGLEEKRKDMAIYYAMVSLMDKYIGKILDKLDELGLTDNTLIVFTTDHGHYFGQHGLIAKGPFMYEDAIKVPMIASLPNKIPSGIVNTSMQSLVDIPVTCLSYCNVQIPYAMTGLNQRLVWEGKEKEVRNHIICEHNHERDSINLRAYVNKEYKLVIWYNQLEGELYDLKNDPNEIKNQWNNPEYADIRQELMMKYMFAELQKESLYMPRVDHA